MPAGVYLPLTAVLGGLLFVRVEGYLEADRDVIRLDPSVETMQAQQGYVCCMPQAVPYQGRGRETYVAPLHCCVRVLPSQVCMFVAWYQGLAYTSTHWSAHAEDCHS